MPRIYVACLAAYNGGRLHGRWIDAGQETDEIWAEMNAMLKASPEPGAEEWAIHDYEGFGGYRLSEYESIEKVSILARAIEEKGEIVGAWLENDDTPLKESDDVDELTEWFDDVYRGEWDSPKEYAYDFVDSVGLPGIGPVQVNIGPDWAPNKVNVADELSAYLDWDALAQWATSDLTEIEMGGNYHYFSTER